MQVRYQNKTGKNAQTTSNKIVKSRSSENRRRIQGYFFLTRISTTFVQLCRISPRLASLGTLNTMSQSIRKSINQLFKITQSIRFRSHVFNRGSRIILCFYTCSKRPGPMCFIRIQHIFVFFFYSSVKLGIMCFFSPLTNHPAKTSINQSISQLLFEVENCLQLF